MFFAVALIASRIAYGFALPAYLTSKGYTLCLQYSSPALAGRNVWVIDPDFCIDNMGSLRDEVMAWFDKQVADQQPLTVARVQLEIANLKAEWLAEQQRLYPHLYAD
ncbi:hypothetical protein GCM10025776_20700 [Corallincola platygyrae]